MGRLVDERGDLLDGCIREFAPGESSIGELEAWRLTRMATHVTASQLRFD